MKTRVKLYHKSPEAKYFDVFEIVNAGTIEEYNRAIGVIIAWEFGFEWEHAATLRRGGGYASRREALTALKHIHQQYKNGLTLKAI